MKLHLIAAAPVALLLHATAYSAPKTIQFSGRCDLLTHIHWIKYHKGTGGTSMNAVWDRSACHDSRSSRAAGIKGRNDGGDNVTYTPDTASLGLPPVIVRLYDTHRWISWDIEGRMLDSGTWFEREDDPAAPRATQGSSLLEAASAKVDDEIAADAPPPPALPSNVRFDDHCDGLTDIVQKFSQGAWIFKGTWDLSHCDLPSTTFASVRNRNRDHVQQAVGTYDTLSQGLGYPSVVLQLGNGLWKYIDMHGQVLAEGTWSPGLPRRGGSVSMP